MHCDDYIFCQMAGRQISGDCWDTADSMTVVHVRKCPGAQRTDWRYSITNPRHALDEATQRSKMGQASTIVVEEAARAARHLSMMLTNERLSGSRESMLLLRYRLEQCLQEHQNCDPKGTWFPTRLLRWKDGRATLIDTAIAVATAPYATRGYIWGRCQFGVLAAENKASFEAGRPFKTSYQASRRLCRQWTRWACSTSGPTATV